MGSIHPRHAEMGPGQETHAGAGFTRCLAGKLMDPCTAPPCPGAQEIVFWSGDQTDSIERRTELPLRRTTTSERHLLPKVKREQTAPLERLHTSRTSSVSRRVESRGGVYFCKTLCRIAIMSFTNKFKFQLQDPSCSRNELHTSWNGSR